MAIGRIVNVKGIKMSINRLPFTAQRERSVILSTESHTQGRGEKSRAPGTN